MKAAILGTTGYTGQLLLRLLASHPAVTRLLPVSSSKAGTPVGAADPGYAGSPALSAGTPFLTVAEAAAAKPDVVFAALPHLTSAGVCAPFLPGGDAPCVVIDLSADFRHTNARLFTEAYGQAPPRPDLQSKSAYGLCELNTEAIRKADIIANPGCYPTATLLPLIPLLQASLVAPEKEPLIVINALSGISGAGKKARVNSLFTERAENTNAYNPGMTHRHAREIAEQLGNKREILFTPHLVPLRRGMAVTTTVTLTDAGQQTGAVASALDEVYGSAPFIGLRGEKSIPETADVRGSNRCDIGWHREGSRLQLFSVIDNVFKGASGQAVQNMNLRFGLDERAGLPLQGEV